MRTENTQKEIQTERTCPCCGNLSWVVAALFANNVSGHFAVGHPWDTFALFSLLFSHSRAEEHVNVMAVDCSLISLSQIHTTLPVSD